MDMAASSKTQPPHYMTMTSRAIIGNLTASYERQGAATSTLHCVMVGKVKCENNNKDKIIDSFSLIILDLYHVHGRRTNVPPS